MPSSVLRIRRAAHAAISRLCMPSAPLPSTAAADIAAEIRGALSTSSARNTPVLILIVCVASACSSGLKVLNEDIVLPAVDAAKRDLVKGGKCPSSEFVPERERERLRSDAANKVTAALADYTANVPKSAADIITGLMFSSAQLQHALQHEHELPLTPVAPQSSSLPTSCLGYK